MPTPKDGESRNDFVSRCTADPEIRNDPSVKGAKDPNAAAVGRCEGVYDEHVKKEREGKQSAEVGGEILRPATVASGTATLPAVPEWNSALATGRPIGVDDDKKVIRGYVVAQEGAFKSKGRGEFDLQSLRSIKKMMDEKPGGLKSRFSHPTMSDDGLGKFLGRSKNPFMDKIMKPIGDGKFKELNVVRADLHLDPSSFTTPYGSLGQYVMDLAKSDPDALSSSLVLKADQEYRLDKQGRPLLDEEGEALPPLWRPKELHASDVVDTGDAVDGFLSVEGGTAKLSADVIDGLPDAAVRRGVELLDRQFAGQPPEVIRARCEAWLNRYLSYRFGEEVLQTTVAVAVAVSSSDGDDDDEEDEGATDGNDGDDDEAIRLQIELMAGEVEG